ncbi:hypothetical protein E2562_009207 [Oryza meyeriana var. granulata]|uniref:Uncharacterized protein n=1 Tax=Oryza meyeriana var. granulata TaxID=110450 RepID=A0A6G1D170_9ORYZ|nr:hypothetical protein E2562_009207 [Oryza meyeriana var. granulata]
MGDPPVLKRPKLEKDDHESAYWPRPTSNGSSASKPQPSSSAAATGSPQEEDDIAEEAVLALIAHRERDVERCKLKLMHYQSLLDTAEKKLTEAQERLARYRDRKPPPTQRDPKPSLPPTTQRDPRPSPPEHKAPEQAARPQLVIPGANTRPAPRPEPMPGLKKTAAPSSSSVPPPPERPRAVEKKPKRKIEQKEHQNLIQSVKKSSATVLRFHGGTVVSSQHKRKLRCLELCPVNDQLVVTSALDGIVTLWQVQPKGPAISLLSTTDCFSPKHRWPEDVAWHPDGDTIFAVYSADNGDSQVSMMNRNISGQKKVTFLPAKPHTKGIINNINFMPWSDVCFVTGGSDHAVILWQEKGDSWNHNKVHKDLHSSAVMGVAGLQQKNTILSVGSDKRIISFDLTAGRTESKNLIDYKCMSVLPNPCDFNLYMVQTAAPGRQLRLFDIRLRQTEVHKLGWKQESSESQSALINQSWSPDGWYLSSGSADPVIHIFDIRHNGQNPCQSVQAHQKRVFKALWHRTAPVLTSISSDLNIGIHKYS